LAEWKRRYDAGEKPTESTLRKQLNAIKDESFPWMRDVPKSVVQQAIKNLGRAFQRFFAKQARYPKFKKKGRSRDSARFDNGPETFRFDGKKIRLPVIGLVRMREELRFEGRALSATVSCVAGKWFVSVPVEIDNPEPVRENQAADVGIDLGVTTAATLSKEDGVESKEGPKPLRRMLKKLRRLSKEHSRKAKGSENRKKSAAKLASLHYRIACQREDWLHKTTTDIVRRFDRIGIEDLNVRGMMANDKLSRAISDVGFFEFRRQLTYKAALHGCRLHVVDRWFPSTKMCPACGRIDRSISLSDRMLSCKCGLVMDRDARAATNLRQALPDVKPVERPALAVASCDGETGL
jgi:putative transposase